MSKGGGAAPSLESMYVTPDLSGVENKILGAVAQPLGAKIEILGVAAQPLAWRRTLAHKEGNSGLSLAYIHRKMYARSIPQTLYEWIILLFIQSQWLKFSLLWPLSDLIEYTLMIFFKCGKRWFMKLNPDVQLADVPLNAMHKLNSTRNTCYIYKWILQVQTEFLQKKHP